MNVWAIADLHLSFGVPNKKMDIFGHQWINHPEKVRYHWETQVHSEDLVLLAGDLSWAMKSEEVIPDLEWIDQLPGTKVLVKGNHDYWWQSFSKVNKILPSSCHVIHNEAFDWKDISIAGTRLWDSEEYNFSLPEELSIETLEKGPDNERIFARELQRLETSLKTLNPKAKHRIAMTHYPPISFDLKDSKVSRLLETYRVEMCLFGHLHNMKPSMPLFGEKNGIRYILTAADYLNFSPIKILNIN